MTGNLSTDIIVVYVPALLAVVMAILGALRGARREAVVSGSIVLAALIIIVWGVPWATDLTNIFTNFSVADSRNILSYIVLALTVLVIGYMLGSALVPRTPISALSRVGGLLLGIANGLAIGGYIIRGQYESALIAGGSANTDLVNVLTSNNIARYLWIWANWFPLAIALIAAVVALVGPFRRAQTTVATPAARTDWGPSTAPAATMASPGPAAYTTGYGQGYTSQYPQVPSQPAQPQYSQQQYGQQYPQQYGQSQAPTQAQQYVPSPAAQQYGQYTPPAYNQQPQAHTPTPAPVVAPVYTPPTSYTPTPPAPSRVEDAPSTNLMATSDTSRPTPPGGQETLYIGSTPPKSHKDTDPELKAPEWPGYSTEPSWLSPSAPSSSSSSGAIVPPALEDNSLVARSEAPTQAQPLIAPAPVPDADSSTASKSDGSSDSAAFVNCTRCGTLVPADATFCTECGNKMKA